MAETLLFNRQDDDAALAALEKALSSVYPNEDISGLIAKLRRRPLVRWIVLRSVRQEASAEGLVSAQGQIDWEAIGDFLVKIAPIIFEILKMFL